MPSFKIRYGDTYFSTYQGVVGVKVFKPQLITIHDPNAVGCQPPASGSLIVEFQPYKHPNKYHTLDERHIREASLGDFQVGDIIRENSLQMFDAEIVEIKHYITGLTDPPIVADQLDYSGLRTGTLFHLEPFECIMAEKLNEDTLDLNLGTLVEPVNNQGREKCFWCHVHTKKVPGFNMDVYDICPKCKK
jgi:hypothetical protein